MNNYSKKSLFDRPITAECTGLTFIFFLYLLRLRILILLLVQKRTEQKGEKYDLKEKVMLHYQSLDKHEKWFSSCIDVSSKIRGINTCAKHIRKCKMTDLKSAIFSFS